MKKENKLNRINNKTVKTKKVKKSKIVDLILLILMIISFIAIALSVEKIGMIPQKIIILFYTIEIVTILLGIFFTLCKKKVFFVINIIILILMTSINSIAFYYTHHLNKFFDNSFVNEIIETTTFYVVTSNSNEINNIDSVTLDKMINYFSISKYSDEAREKLGKYDYEETEDVNKFLLDNKDKDFYLLIDKVNYMTSFELDEKLKESDYKVIYEFDITKTEKRNNEVKDTYTILVMGKDFSNKRNDLNMLITINTITHKMLITSIPRDFYIPTVGYKYNDSLMVMGILGDDVVIDSLEAYFGIKIDYKINVYTENLVNIVDELKGIEYCSDSSYYTTHALVLGTYDDSTGEKFYVRKGCQKLNGIQTLTVARERLAFKSGDKQRQINCRKIMISILNKIASMSTLTNYTSILDSFSDFYKTDINKNTAISLAKSVINNGGYKIIEQSVDGTGGIGPLRQNTCVSDLMYPDESSVKTAADKINKLIEEK